MSCIICDNSEVNPEVLLSKIVLAGKLKICNNCNAELKHSMLYTVEELKQMLPEHPIIPCYNSKFSN